MLSANGERNVDWDTPPPPRGMEGTCSIRKSSHLIRTVFQLGHVLTLNGGWIFVWGAFSLCSLREWREEFRLGHMLTLNGGWIFDWDAFSPCSHRKWRENFPIGTRAHGKWRVDFRLGRASLAGSAGQPPGSLQGGQWVLQHTYLKMIPMMR